MDGLYVQVDLVKGPRQDLSHKGRSFASGSTPSVDELVRQGIVDPKRVGRRFSRGGYQVFYAVTHPGRVPLAAAMGSDFSTGSYTEYLMFGFSFPMMQN